MYDAHAQIAQCRPPTFTHMFLGIIFYYLVGQELSW